MVGLVCTGEPQPDESLSGFVLRLSAANGFPNSRWLLRHAGLSPGFEFRRTDLSRLASLAKISVERFDGAGFEPLEQTPRRSSFNGRAIQRVHLLCRGERICPQCLKDRGFASRLWHLRAYAACHVHGALLVDECPNCGRPLRWERRFLDQCSCGAKVGPSQRATESVLQVARLLAIVADGQAVAPFDRGSVDGVASVVWFFGASNDAGARERTSIYKGRTSVAVSAQIIEQGAAFTTDWNESFDAWLSARFHRDAPALGIGRDFGPELARLRAIFEDECPFVIERLRTFFAANWQGFLQRKQNYFCAPKDARFIGSAETARVLGINISRVDGFIRSGKLRAMDLTSGRRTYRAIHADDVEVLRRYLKSLLTHEEAAAALGVSCGRVRHLRRHKIISAALLIDGAHRFELEPLRAFCDSLAAGRRKTPTEQSVRLTDVKRLPLQKLISYVQDGSIAAHYGPKPISSLDNLFLDRLELGGLQLRAQRAVHGVVTARQACRVLGIGHPTLHALVKLQELEAVWEAGRLIAVSKPQVDQLQRRIVTAAQAAANHGLAPAAITRRLKSMNVEPLVAPSPAQKIAAVWWKRDLAEIDFSTQWITGCGRPSTPAKSGQTILLSRRAGPTIGAADVALGEISSRLHIDRETLRHLTLNGYFEPGGFTRAGHLRGVTKASARRFERTFISSSMVARENGLAGPAVTRRLLSMGVKPILVGSQSARVQLCWRRDDLTGIDFKAQYITPCGRPSQLPSVQGATLLPLRPRGSPTLTEGAMYVHGATGLLGTNSSSLRAVVEKGLVRAARYSATGKILTVLEDDVLRFDERYIFTPKLASENGLSVRSVSARLANLGIKPVTGGRRPVHALWDRETLKVINLLERWVTAAGEISEQSSLLLETS